MGNLIYRPVHQLIKICNRSIPFKKINPPKIVQLIETGYPKWTKNIYQKIVDSSCFHEESWKFYYCIYFFLFFILLVRDNSRSKLRSCRNGSPNPDPNVAVVYSGLILARRSFNRCERGLRSSSSTVHEERQHPWASFQYLVKVVFSDVASGDAYYGHRIRNGCQRYFLDRRNRETCWKYGGLTACLERKMNGPPATLCFSAFVDYVEGKNLVSETDNIRRGECSCYIRIL